MTALALAVYEPDGATFITHLPKQRGNQCLHELNGDGNGQFELHIDGQTLTDHPDLLADGNIIAVRPTNVTAPVFGWKVESISRTLTADGGKASRQVTVRGRGTRVLLQTGLIRGEYDLRPDSPDQRAFDFTSKVGPWKVLADWDAPVGVLWTAETTARANNPVDWPDTSAYWIWSSDPEATAAAGRNYFRGVFTTGVVHNISIFATGDNFFSLFLDGQQVMQSDLGDRYGWQKMLRYDAEIAAGTHTIAAWVDNEDSAAANPGAFLAVATTVDDEGIPVTVLTRTNTTDWEVRGYGDPPGWFLSQILSTTVTEAQARGEIPAEVVIDFDDDEDSDAVAWTDDDRSDRSFPVGTDLLTMLGNLTERGLDVDMTWDLTLKAWRRRGTDLSSTVRLLPGKDVLQHAPETQYGGLRNSALIRHGTGWLEVEDATSIATHGRRAIALTVGETDSAEEATKVALAYFEDSANPQVTLSFTINSETPGPKPYRDFNLGDVIKVPGEDGALVNARLMSIAMTELVGSVDYELDFYPEA